MNPMGHTVVCPYRKNMNYLPSIDSQKETETIIDFLKTTFASQNITKAVIGISGGIDSAVSLHLLSLVLPKENIFPIHLPYFEEDKNIIKRLSSSTGIPESIFQTKSIKSIVEIACQELHIDLESNACEDQIRAGNLMARIRMMMLFDVAKEHRALVCGTENKSENFLGYFTRNGDNASDIEPISHLYKTQVRELAKFLQVPPEIINQPPSAGLWKGQTDEKQFGFSYEEADQVLYLYFEKKLSADKIKSLGFKNATKIISLVEKNSFKHKVPYVLR
jgi:NAD+ synthase